MTSGISQREDVRVGRSRGRTGRWLPAAIVSGAVLLLLAVPFVYWAYASFVPDPPRLPGTMPSLNGYVQALDAARRLELVVNEGHPADPPPLPVVPSVEEARRRLALARPYLNQLRATFRQEWRVTAPHSWGEPSEVEPFRATPPYFRAESREAASRRDLSTAVRRCLDLVELGSLLCRGGGTGERIRGQSLQEAAIEELEPLVWRLPLDDLREHIVRVRRLRQEWVPITETLVVERILRLRGCVEHLRLVREKSMSEQLDDATRGMTATSTLLIRATPSWQSLEVWREVLTPSTARLYTLDGYYRRLIDASSRPAPNGVPVASLEDRLVGGFADRSFTGRYRGEWPRNNLALLETALAVRAHRLSRGSYPRSLEEVDRTLLPRVPQDVWGHSVRYRLENGRPKVYSLSADGADDGFIVDPSSVIDGAQGDLVFGYLSQAFFRGRKVATSR